RGTERVRPRTVHCGFVDAAHHDVNVDAGGREGTAPGGTGRREYQACWRAHPGQGRRQAGSPEARHAPGPARPGTVGRADRAQRAGSTGSAGGATGRDISTPTMAASSSAVGVPRVTPITGLSSTSRSLAPRLAGLFLAMQPAAGPMLAERYRLIGCWSG